MSRKSRIKIFDFETTGPVDYVASGEAKIRHAAFSPFIDWNEPLEEIRKKKLKNYFTNTRDTMEFILNQRDGTFLYAVNTAKFDGHFIIEFFTKNYKLLDRVKKNDSFIKNSFLKQGDRCFWPMKDDKNRIFEIRIRNKKGANISIRCLINLYGQGTSVKNMIKSLGWNEFLDTKINEDYKEYDISDAEWNEKIKDKEFLNKRREYLNGDIVAPWGFIVRDYQNNEFSPFKYHKKYPLTASAHAWKILKKLALKKDRYIFNSHYGYNKFCIDCNSQFCKHEKTDNRHVLDLDLYDKFTQCGTRGGWTFYTESNTEIVHENLFSIDINSSYPHKYTEFNLPYGTPKQIPITQNYRLPNKLYFRFIKLYNYEYLKDPNILPAFLPKLGLSESIKGRFGLKFDCTQKVPFLLVGFWEDELECVEKYYKMNYQTTEIYEFKCDKLIGELMAPLLKIKQESADLCIKDGAKLIINSVYGKLYEKRMKETNFVFVNGKGEIEKIKDFTEHGCKYPPAGSRITWLGRKQLLEQSEKIIALKGKLLYGDTDSIKFTGFDPRRYTKELAIGNELGQWKLENENGKLKVLGAKLYIEYKLNKENKWAWVSRAKGYTKNIPFERFNYGEVFTDKIARELVNGGVILDNTTYEIKKHNLFFTYPIKNTT